MRVCKTCGKENLDHYKFCLGCGQEMTSPPPPAVEPPPQQPVARVAHVESGVRRAGPSAPTVAPIMPETAPTPPPTHAAAATAVTAESLEPPIETRICPSCGAEVPNFTFCGQCGARLTKEAAPRARAQAPAAVAKPARGKLVLIRPDGTEGGTQTLYDGENLVGRGTGALFDADNYLSPRHAFVNIGASSIVVRDAGSLNGVFVKLTDEEEIVDKDVFRIGQELLRFDIIRPPVPTEDGTEVMGSPNPGYWGRLALIIGKDQDGSAFPLFGEGIVLGRERGDILFPEDGYVSGTHARLAMRNDRFFLSDMNSSNGTFLRIHGERTVRTGTFVLMGQQLFRIQFG